ncbi:hypothetical protein I4U23_004575 [Adineta vaga]|nr:hypothetical protein I4U23_004575 [Adineta vaga]
MSKRIIWHYGPVNVNISTASKNSPAVDDATVYVEAGNGRFYAVDQLTGELKWRFLTRPAKYGIHGTPAVDQQYAFIGGYSTLEWEVKMSQSIGANPVIVSDRVYWAVEVVFSSILHRLVHKISDTVTFEQNALINPAAVVFDDVKTSNLQSGAIINIQLVEFIFLFSIVEKRLDRTCELGTTLAINGNEESVHVYFDAADVESTFTTNIALSRKDSRVILIAIFEKLLTLDAMDIVLCGITIRRRPDYQDTFSGVI